jgi:phosphoribosylglycinamide formyltransferase 1
VGKLVLYTDGASRGNPGPGAAAYILQDAEGRTLSGRAVFLAQTTNNTAEYTAVIEGLQAAKAAGAVHIELLSDSELVIRQIHGQYKVKSDTLRELFMQVMELLASFQSWKATHILREKNQQADCLANRAVDLQHDAEWETGKPENKTRPVRLAILISGGGRTMLNIDKAIKADQLPAQIVTVICSRKEIKGVQLSRQIGFEPAIIRVKDCPDVESFSQKIVEMLDAAKVDLVIQAGWLCLWHIPERYANRVMNIHPALLPSFGGQGMWGHHVHEAVLRAGCKVSGCTVHFCTNEYDQGPIIIQRTCPVFDDDTPDTLADRVFEQECLAYPEAIKLYAEGRIVVENGKIHTICR